MKTVLKLLLFLAAFCGIYWFVFYQTPQQKIFARELALAQSGDVQAAVRTAEFFKRGEGVRQDGAQAAEWYRKAALAGDAGAAYELAELYITGDILPKDEAEALVYLRLAAQADEPRAQRELARFYEEGLGGVEKHRGEALLWRFFAVQNGDRESVLALEKAQKDQPELYAQIKALEENLTAAREGSAAARIRAGLAYRTGNSVLQNNEEAARLFTLAWEENKQAQAAYELSEMYRNGVGVEQDANKAAALMGQAAQLAYPAAQYALGEEAYKADPPRYQDAFAWFSNAAAGGDVKAQYMTGFMLMQGQGTERSVPLAVKFFRDAAEHGHVAAQYVLGQIYVKGLGIAPDKKAGKDWLSHAAQNGSTDAQMLLDSLQ